MRVKMILPDGRGMEFGKEYLLALFAGLGEYRFVWTRRKTVVIEEIGPFGLVGKRTKISKKHLKRLTAEDQELIMWLCPMDETTIEEPE